MSLREMNQAVQPTIVCAGYHNLPAIAKPPKQPARQDNTAKDKNIYSTAIA